MEIELSYGTENLIIDLPDDRTTVVEPVRRPGVSDPGRLLRDTVRNPVAGPPLRECVRAGQKVAISMCDGTRPQPRMLMIGAVLDELSGIVDPKDIVVLVATGTHRPNTDEELEEMLGAELLGRVRVVNHDCRDTDSLVYLGEFGAGVPVSLNREWVEADVRITTGFVEPHFFAGFSGGPKLVAPGLAALETVLTLHDARRIGSEKATWGVREGNPVHDDVRAIARGTGVDFAFDVILNREKEIVDAFAGEMFSMHDAASEVARELAMVSFDEPFDVVVTTNSGYPLDQNLYQAVKGMSAAENAVRSGGLIICAAECRDGLPGGSEYERVLASAESIGDVLSAIEARPRTEPDQWQVQIQARVQAKARVGVYTDYLSEAELAAGHLERIDDISEAVRTALGRAGPGARVCVLPEGPQTIPYLKP
ncbi:nickel-dependent lactate racemase [Rubrobacter indicoceani]|uniref:nickel-dependent lactate racemase n=1 Tax=Rubrobacter indicoceani TaxID=2051957 RepID=UPI000E5BD18C|nr:nickel-dependent lactate racemase [Rubrobacter indicoceani]